MMATTLLNRKGSLPSRHVASSSSRTSARPNIAAQATQPARSPWPVAIAAVALLLGPTSLPSDAAPGSQIIGSSAGACQHTACSSLHTATAVDPPQRHEHSALDSQAAATLARPIPSSPGFLSPVASPAWMGAHPGHLLHVSEGEQTADPAQELQPASERSEVDSEPGAEEKPRGPGGADARGLLAHRCDIARTRQSFRFAAHVSSPWSYALCGMRSGHGMAPGLHA